MSASTHAARYTADHIETGEGDEACSECDGDGCRACHWRGLVAASAHACQAGRGYDCERHEDGAEMRGTERTRSTCEGKGTVPHRAAPMNAKSGPASTARRPSARAPRPLLALADMPARSSEREVALVSSLLETERRIRSAGIVRLHCSLVVAGHAVRLAGERRGAPAVYGAGADLAEAFADLFRNVALDAALDGAR